MIIGDTVAAAHYDRSKLYDPEFTTEFREAVKSKNTSLIESGNLKELLSFMRLL